MHFEEPGSPRQQKAHVLQITSCSFQVQKSPKGVPCSLAASGQLILWLCFHGNKNWMGEKRRKKVLMTGGISQLGR